MCNREGCPVPVRASEDSSTAERGPRVSGVRPAAESAEPAESGSPLTFAEQIRQAWRAFDKAMGWKQ